MSKPGPRVHRPTRDFVRSVAAQEATKAGVTLDEVIGGPHRPTKRALNARRKAMYRIAMATGCSARALAAAWGTHPVSVRRALTAIPAPYDARTYNKLVMAHGERRARRIINGVDPAANADLEAWSRVGAGRLDFLSHTNPAA